MTINNTLDQWACSFSGCDGGSPDSNVWLCGIEWGYENATDAEREEYYKNGLPQEISIGEQTLDENYDFFTDESMGFPFNLAFAKLYSAIVEKDIPQIDDKILKLNLSPIAFREDNEDLWSENLVQATGFESKSKFIKYILNLNRFELITKAHKPELIICIGNGYKDHFNTCFFGGNSETGFSRTTIRPEATNKNQNNRYIYHTKFNDTLLVVTPFSTSSNGLNSDHLLRNTGEAIRGLL